MLPTQIFKDAEVNPVKIIAIWCANPKQYVYISIYLYRSCIIGKTHTQKCAVYHGLLYFILYFSTKHEHESLFVVFCQWPVGHKVSIHVCLLLRIVWLHQLMRRLLSGLVLSPGFLPALEKEGGCVQCSWDPLLVFRVSQGLEGSWKFKHRHTPSCSTWQELRD